MSDEEKRRHWAIFYAAAYAALDRVVSDQARADSAAVHMAVGVADSMLREMEKRFPGRGYTTADEIDC